MKLHKLILIALIVVAIVILVGAVGVLLGYQAPPTLEIELNPLPPLTVKSGDNFSIDISVRNNPGFKATARHVRGELELPEGFIEESKQNRTRQLIFGTIIPGDASHYGLTIIVSNSIVLGEYHAILTIWGENLPRQAIDIRISVIQNQNITTSR